MDMMKKVIIAIILIGLTATTAYAKSAAATAVPKSKNVSIACVGTAVDARENALGVGITAYNKATATAYSTRAAMLHQAYLGSDLAQLRVAVKNSWTNFKLAKKETSKNWKLAKTAAWNKFKTDVKACKAPLGTSDSNNSNSETLGQ